MSAELGEQKPSPSTLRRKFTKRYMDLVRFDGRFVDQDEGLVHDTKLVILVAPASERLACLLEEAKAAEFDFIGGTRRLIVLAHTITEPLTTHQTSAT